MAEKTTNQGFANKRPCLIERWSSGKINALQSQFPGIEPLSETSNRKKLSGGTYVKTALSTVQVH